MSEKRDQDKGQLLSIFSAEVWLLVLNNVKDASDFQRISNASPYFRTLLRPRATHVLFPEALLILRQQQLSRKELLPLRQVCHAWKSGVETALRDPNHMLLSWSAESERPELNPPFPEPNLRAYESFRRVKDFTRFQQHFRATHHHQAAAQGNPFFCQFVDITLPWTLQDFPPYFEACLEFLEIYGDHVRYCWIEQKFRDDAQHLQFYATGLPQILALMPNLKVCDLADFRHRSKSQSFQEQVRHAVETSPTPMPELKQLQRITVLGLALPFLKELVQGNPQVSILRGAGILEEYVKFCLEQVPRLTRLELLVHREYSMREFESAKLHCQLSTLYLKFADHLFAQKGLERLFSMLEARLSATLTELWLDGQLQAAQEEVLTLRLPHLKKLTLVLRGPVIPLDFMLPLENTLEELTLGYLEYHRRPEAPFSKEQVQKGDKTVKLYQFWAELEKSNVWVLFPRLKMLRTEGIGKPRLCTRNQWIAAQRK